MKSTTRAALIKKLTTVFPGMKCRLGEEFSGGYKGTVWTGEDAPSVDGNAMFNHYGFDVDPREQVWVLGVHRKLEELLKACGWHAEFYDAGTVFLYRDCP